MLIIVGGSLTWSGCDALVVDVRDQVLAEDVEVPEQAAMHVTSIQAAFECAFGAHVVLMGLLSGELAYFGSSSTPTAYEARVWPGDDFPGGGNCDNAVNIALYGPLNTARWFADDVLRRLDGWSDAEVANRSALVARTAAYGGYSRILIGESQCSAVIDGGPELTPTEVFQTAEEYFDRAIAVAEEVGETDIRYMALVGRARARLNLNRPAEAADDARRVPMGFEYHVTASSIDRYRRNRVFDWNNTLRNVGVNEAFQALTVGGVPDPRVELTRAPTVATRDFYVQHKYDSLDDPIPLATWREAQLIIAEAEGGSVALDIINMFHDRAGLPAFSGTDAEIMKHLIEEERRRELFLESHRIGDIRRYELPFLPPAGTPYEGGAYAGEYGSEECMGLPRIEIETNPRINR